MHCNSSQDMYEETGTDNNGNLRMEKLAHTVGTPFSVDRSFGYDIANRLTSYSEPTTSKSQTFGHDAFGNLWQTAASGVPPLRPNSSSWYLMTNGSVSNRLANTDYDAAGHQTQLSLTPGTTARYDAEGRVSRVELNSNPVATYDYDADGRRVKKTVGATTTHYVYSADGQLMAEYGGTPASVGTQYLVADHLGSTRLILDAQGNCAERIDYAPFGAQLTRSGQPCYTSSTSGLPLFTSQIRDGESSAGTDTGLDYFNARYFWATLGRLTSPDPFLIMTQAEDRGQLNAYLSNPQNWNRYAYALNNPLRYVDPTGLTPISVEDCQKDPACSVVKLNVILNTNADIYDRDGNLRQEYQAKLTTQLAQAADEYGNANIAFDVNYTSAAVDSKYVGAAGAINVVVTDSVESLGSKGWLGPSGASYIRLNIGTSLTNTYDSTLAHELSHHLTGDTRSWGIPGISNAIADINNDLGRAILRNWNTSGGRVLRTVNPFQNLHRRAVMQNARRWYGGR